MMKPTNIPRTSMKHAIGLGLAMLSLSLLGSVARADNTTAAKAWSLSLNTGVFNFVATLGDTKFFVSDLFVNRSYELSLYAVGKEFQVGPNLGAVALASSIDVATDMAFTQPVQVLPWTDKKEGSFNNGSAFCCFAQTVTLTPTTTGAHFIKVPTQYSTGSFYISIRETTLFSPWASRGAGFEGFIELHNNTNAAVSVTLRAHDSTGAVQGSPLTFSMPANATVFHTATEVGVPAGVFAGIVLTHNGSFGAISGNITTLNGANGLSFDSPFTPRIDNIRLH